MREIEFSNGGYYHVFSRGTDKRKIFLCDADFERFLESMYLFNDSLYTHSPQVIDRVVALASSEVMSDTRKPRVKIVAFCLMDNHYHLLLEQLQDEGVSKFMHSLNKGYSRFFNRKYKRSGTLFESTFKAVVVKSLSQLAHLPVYVHLNALDSIDSRWREGLLGNWEAAQKHLDNYRWSSHQKYIGQEQYLPIIDENTPGDIYQNIDDYTNHLKNWSARESTNFANFSNSNVT